MKNEVVGWVTGIKSHHDVKTQKTEKMITIKIYEAYPIEVGESVVIRKREEETK